METRKNKHPVPILLGVLVIAGIMGLAVTLALDMTAGPADTTAATDLVEVITPVPSDTDANSLRTVDLVIRAGDTVGKRLQAMGVSSDTVSALLNNQIARPVLTTIYPGQHLTLSFDESNDLISLEQAMNETQRLLVRKEGPTEYAGEIVDIPIATHVKYAYGTIDDSFFLAGQKAGLDDNLIFELVNIFSYDIDFALDIQPEDHFALLYEERFVGDNQITPGRILAAEFVNQGKVYQAIRFEDNEGHADYYTPDGKALQKAFLRSPVKFSRISSHFTSARKHPILNRVRAHRGVDYAAPSGTPVKASGEGKVIFAGRKSGYGNCIILQHGKEYTTLYGHLSRFASQLRTGNRVEQGQTIGYVGMTGLATAPHLHYEFRVNGVHQNPLSAALPTSQPIPSKYRERYLAQAQTLLRQMSYHATFAMAPDEKKTPL
jgi:murein DD-endopeptidase MepM/ murein hydrolase activator NlpD